VGPDRALADHVFAHRLLTRAGSTIVIPAGPLVVTPDLATGVPSDPATRSGRALALQLLAVALACGDGLPSAGIIVGALPDWITDEHQAPARAAAEVELRRALLPDHGLAFMEPAAAAPAAWAALVSALLPDAHDVTLVLRRPTGPVVPLLEAARQSAAVADGLRGTREPGRLTGVAREHAARVVEAAVVTLAALEESGWTALVDQPLGRWPGGGGEATATRTGGFDPLAPEAAGA